MQNFVGKTFFCLYVAVGTVFSRTSAGNAAISGTVSDPSGAVIPNAIVTLNNDKLGLHRVLRTTGGGILMRRLYLRTAITR
jgi:hypothetical protein